MSQKFEMSWKAAINDQFNLIRKWPKLSKLLWSIIFETFDTYVIGLIHPNIIYTVLEDAKSVSKLWMVCLINVSISFNRALQACNTIYDIDQRGSLEGRRRWFSEQLLNGYVVISRSYLSTNHTFWNFTLKTHFSFRISEFLRMCFLQTALFETPHKNSVLLNGK